MQAVDEKVSHFLNKNQQFTIPIFQRKYDWQQKQCKQLFEDIIRIGQSDDESHFLGSIVHLNDDHNIIPTYRVIDGQQRLTTLTLLISALAKYLYLNHIDEIEITPKKLLNYYLINPSEEGDLEYKIKLNDSDKKTLQKIIDNVLSENEVRFKEGHDSKRIIDNYHYFIKNINENNAKNIFQGFQKLSIIVISLKERLDNPQLIFESLNSKGLPLSKSDLIRNYVLMGLNPHEQDKIYTDYWKEMEDLFEEIDYQFDRFIKDYLTIKLNKTPVDNEIYYEFKKYAQNFYRNHDDDKFVNIKNLTMDIYKYFNYFSNFYAGTEKNEYLRISFESINELGYKIICPFILKLYDDYTNEKLNENDFIAILNLTESFLFRRYICDLPSNSLNKFFAGVYERLDKSSYVGSYKLTLLAGKNNMKFPNNREFGRDFKNKDLYKKKNFAKYTLRKLENFNFEKEPTDVKNLSIEHIMPQNEELSEEWQKDLGREWRDIQRKYLHTIGNLTLTGYNQKLSDSSFITKRDMENGFKLSSIRLNKPLAKLNHWNESQILKRANDFTQKAYKIWPYPKLQTKLK